MELCKQKIEKEDRAKRGEKNNVVPSCPARRRGSRPGVSAPSARGGRRRLRTDRLLRPARRVERLDLRFRPLLALGLPPNSIPLHGLSLGLQLLRLREEAVEVAVVLEERL